MSSRPQRLFAARLPRTDLYKVGEKGLVIDVPCGFVIVSPRSAVIVSEVFAEMLIKDVSDCYCILIYEIVNNSLASFRCKG